MLQKLLAEKQAQKEALKKKLDARKMLSEQKEYEKLTARALIKQANENIKNIEENVAREMGKQSNVVCTVNTVCFTPAAGVYRSHHTLGWPVLEKDCGENCFYRF